MSCSLGHIWDFFFFTSHSYCRYVLYMLSQRDKKEHECSENLLRMLEVLKKLAVTKLQRTQMLNMSVARDFSHHFVDAQASWQNGDMLPKLSLIFVDRGGWCFDITPHITSLYLCCLWHRSPGNFPKSLTARTKTVLVVRDFPGQL